jgi:hypothetical protein
LRAKFTKGRTKLHEQLAKPRCGIKLHESLNFSTKPNHST